MNSHPSIQQLTGAYREDLAPVLESIIQAPPMRQLLGERTVLHHGTYTCMQDFIKSVTKGSEQAKRMQLAIEADALDKIIKMDLSKLPGLEALVKANLMQHHCGINHTQMLMVFEKACIQFEQGDVDMALSIFMLLLFLNPFIATLWYVVARAFETKGNLEQSLYAYAICELLTKGNIYSGLDAVECLVARGNKRLAQALLHEIQYDLNQYKFPKEINERASKLKDALSFL